MEKERSPAGKVVSIGRLAEVDLFANLREELLRAQAEVWSVHRYGKDHDNSYCVFTVRERERL